MKSIKHVVEYAFFLLLLTLFRLLPPLVVSHLGFWFGRLCYRLKIRRKVVSRNLEIAFGNELSLEAREVLCKKVFESIGMVMFEFVKMASIPKEDVHDYMQVEGGEKLIEALKQGKGAVLAGCHIGNWELMSAGTHQPGYPLYGYAGQQKNLLVDQAINKIRQKFGMMTISKSKHAPRDMIKALKENRILAIGGDLNVPHDNLFVDFFGQKAAMGKGQVAFTVKQNCPLLFFWNERVGQFKYRTHIEVLPYQLTGDSESDIQHMAQLISSHLEMVIRKIPDHYFWFNRRWKTRPAGSADLYED